MNQRMDSCAVLMGAIKLNQRFHICILPSLLMSLFHTRGDSHIFQEKLQFVAGDGPSCQPAKALARLHLTCLCLRRCSGGDCNSMCEMIFEVIKESHSVKLTGLMGSRNCLSRPNSKTDLLTAAGGAQRDSVVAGRVCSL